MILACKVESAMDMPAKSQTSVVLLVLVLLITFPIWIAAGGILIGMMAGLFGIIIGVFGAVVGALFALIALPFKLIFGGHHWGIDGWDGFYHVHNKTYVIVALILVVALLVRRKRRTN
jgi:hypothetical protein